jgi:hypothetical protein
VPFDRGMKLVRPDSTTVSESVDFLVARVEGLFLAIPAGQVQRVIGSSEATGGSFRPTAVSLREALHIAARHGSSGDGALLEVRTLQGSEAVLVDQVEGIVTLGPEQVQRLPSLVEAQKSGTLLRGLAVVENQVMYLVDLTDLVPTGREPGRAMEKG